MPSLRGGASLHGGTVVLEGNVANLKTGAWPIVVSPAITAGSAAGWTCPSGSSHYAMSVAARADVLELHVCAKGTIIMFR